MARGRTNAGAPGPGNPEIPPRREPGPTPEPPAVPPPAPEPPPSTEPVPARPPEPGPEPKAEPERPAASRKKKTKAPPPEAVPGGNEPVLPSDQFAAVAADAAASAGPAAPAEPKDAEPALDESAALRTFEALLFVSAEPLAPAAVRKIVPGATPARVRRWAESLAREYEERGRAFLVREVAGGWQLLTRPEHAEAIGRLLKVRGEGKLSGAAMETLAIIAYRQPINRADLESIRGVASGPLLRALMEKGLVKVAGKEETLGRPVLYGTTDRFLELLGLASLKDLPKPEDLKG